MWLLQNEHRNAIRKKLLAISTALGPVALIDPGIKLALDKWNKYIAEHKSKDS